MTAAKTKTLGSVISVSKGKKHLVVDAPSSSSKRLLGIDDLRNDNLLRYTDDPSGTRVLPEDVLIAWDGANAGTIGYGKSGYIGSTIARLRINDGEKIFTPFLGNFLKSKFEYLRQTATGATIPHISRKALDDIELPDVDFHDQIRIAHLLGKVEVLIFQRKQNLQQLDDLLKSVFLEMFGDPVRNERGWKTERLGDIALIERGRFSPRPRNDPKFYGGKYPFIQTGDISRSNGRLREYTQTLNDHGIKVSKEFKVGTIVIAIVGATIGEAAILEIPTYAPDSVIGITPKEMGSDESVFMEYVLRFWKPVLRAKAPEAARANINIETLRPLSIVMPPNRATFSEAVVKVERLKVAYQQSLTDLENIYGALSQKAFKGELDLSRVPLLAMKPQEDEPVTVEPIQPSATEIAINLPDTDNLLEALQHPSAREARITQWLKAYRGQIGDAPFSIQRFMAAAETRLAELHPDNGFELSNDDYEHIKTWVFEALASGTLTQTFDDDGNRIQLKAGQA